MLRLFTDNLNTTLNRQNKYVYSFGDWRAKVTGISPRPFDRAFKAAMDAVKSGKVAKIHFNLEGIKEIDGISQSNPYIDFAERFGSKGDIASTNRRFPEPPPPFITADELYIVKNDARLCSETIFYENGSRNLTPYGGQICGQ